MQNLNIIINEIKKVDADPEKNHSIISADYETDDGLLTGDFFVKGTDHRVGDSLNVQGSWKKSVWNGVTKNSFGAWKVRSELPKTMEGAELFLSYVFSQSPMQLSLHGITTKAIRSLLEKHGPEILTQAVDYPELLVELSPYSKDTSKVKNILAFWNSRITEPRAVSLMQTSGLDSKIIDRIMGAWGKETLNKLSSDPYRAITIPKINFDDLDRMGKHLGIPPEDERRLTAGVINVLRKRAEDGSTAIDLPTLLLALNDVSGVKEDSLSKFLIKAAKNQNPDFKIIDTGNGSVAALTSLYEAEALITHRMVDMLIKGRKNDYARAQAFAEQLFKRPEFIKLDPVQRVAVLMTAIESVCVLTGGPGTGKSSVMDAVAQLCKFLDGGPLFLAAPTGKASKRLEETTGLDATTIHRLLGATGEIKNGVPYFKYNENNLLPSRCTIIIDESSMVDVLLMSALMKALPSDARIIIVGDDGQLPSVGSGNVLADLLYSKINETIVVPSIKLEEVYRQAKDSAIATGAALIRKGKLPQLSRENNAGVSFNEMDPRMIVDEIERIVCEELPSQNIDPLREVAVLCPQAKGRAGTWEINKRLSERLNPNASKIPGVHYVDKIDDPDMPIPRMGDRVMLTENDIKQDVMNGDTGQIIGVNQIGNKKTICVKFDSGKTADIPVAQWRSLILAYAGTIHKSQGSQYKAVIMPMSMGHIKMLDRTLLYTGWTRAQSRLYLLGEKLALEHSVKNSKGNQRKTLLRRFLSSLNLNLIKNTGRVDWIAKLKIALEQLELSRVKTVEKKSLFAKLSDFVNGAPENNKVQEEDLIPDNIRELLSKSSANPLQEQDDDDLDMLYISDLRFFTSTHLAANIDYDLTSPQPEEDYDEELFLDQLRPFSIKNSSAQAADYSFLSAMNDSLEEGNTREPEPITDDAPHDEESFQMNFHM